MLAEIEPVSGRYVKLLINGRPNRIYFEEAGAGIPLLCLHTAGTDSRQYRGVLNDAEVTANYRVIAFDMPWHGKSSPPPGFQRESYSLTAEDYISTILAVMDGLELEKPVVMGCSMGGRIVLQLAMEKPERLRAVIGLQSGLGARLSISDVVDKTEYLNRPDVNAGEAAASLCHSLLAPNSPSEERWETMWHYMQSGSGVFAGDVDYYLFTGDLRNGRFKVGPDPCPMYLLTGEYDWSASPETTQEILALNPRAKFQEMKNIGHFPMSENPKLFLQYLLPVLREIAEERPMV